MAALEFIDITGEITEDAWGLSFFPWQGRLQQPQDLLATFHLLTIAPGQTRGNDLHPAHEEWLYPFNGTGVLLWQESGGPVQVREVSGNRTLIRVAPGVAHALRNPGPEPLYLLAWREAVGEESTGPDTVPKALQVE